MLSFKKTIGIFIYSIALVVLLAGCLRGTDKPDSEAKGVRKSNDFRVLEIRGRSIADIKHETWSFPIQKTYEFRACLIGRSTQAAIPSGMKFQIIKPNQTRYESTTDDMGCLNWTEVLPFNFTGDSVYIRKARVLKGIGTYKGEVDINIGVNPWLEYRNEAGNEVVDLNRSDIAENNIIDENISDPMKASLFTRNRQSSALLLDPDVSLQLIPVKDTENGKELKLILRLKPYIEALNMRGEPERQDLKTGDFRVSVQLVSNYVGEKSEQRMLLAPELLLAKAEMNQSGVLSVTKNINLIRRVSMGQVQLALRVEPLYSPVELKPYEGLHNVGRFIDLYGASSATQVQGHLSQENFSYAEFIKNTTNFEDLKAQGIAQNLPPVYYSPMEARFVRIASGETSTHRTVIYRVSTVVTDSISGDIVAHQPFKIQKHFSGTEETVVSDENGVIRWFDSVSHAYYKPEQYFFPKFTLTQTVSSNKKDLTLAINPWDEGWTFGDDVRGNERYYQEMSEVEVRKPLFMVDAFRYQTIRFRYVIDEHLTLNVKKAVVMALDPLVQRFTIKEGRKFEPLRDGIYLVKVALVKHYIDPFQNNTRLVKDTQTGEHTLEMVSESEEAKKGEYTTVIKKLLRVQAGRITTPLEFSMRDLRMMSIRSNIMVQIETIDERKLLRDNIIHGKLNELYEDYIRLNTEGMSIDEKEAFIAEKQKTFSEEVTKLESTMAAELEDLRQEREQNSELFAERDRVLSRLEDRLGDLEAARATQTYKDNMNMPQEEFEKKIREARNQFVRMEEEMRDYWSSWQKQWLAEQAQARRQNESTGTGLSQIPNEHLDTQPGYLDYLGIMQTFLDDFGLGGVVGESDLRRLEVNNYTLNPAAPFIDLNLYRNDSGLERRTFIGPCTLVANDNMSELRPTNTIDEQHCDRIDCSEELYTPAMPPADNSEFEDSAYHDSLKPFANIHVDDIIDRHIENEKRYEKEMNVISQKGNFVNAYNLDYVSLNDEPLVQYIPGCSFVEEENCFEPSPNNVVESEGYLARMNSESARSLLQRYFYVRPEHRTVKINEEIVRKGTLQPIWERGSGILANLFNNDDLWATGVPYADRGIGNRYLHTAGDYLSERDLGDDTPITKDEVRGWLHKGTQNLDLLQSLRLCKAMSSNVVENLKAKSLLKEGSSFWAPPKKTSEEYMLEYCFSKIHHFPESNNVVLDGVSFDRRYIVHKTGAYEHIAGKNTNLNVGIDFSISGYQDVSTVASLGLNGGGLLGIAAVGIGAFGGPLTAGMVSGAGGMVIATGTVNSSEGVSKSVNTTVMMATFLVVQKAEMDVVIEEHEKCLITQFSPDFINGIDWELLRVKDEVPEQDLEIRKALSRGFMICDGEVTKTPEKVRENYYYVTQHFTAGDMLDEANLLNHVWLLSLRGERDFNTFIHMLETKNIDSKGEVIEQGQGYNYSLRYLERIYSRVLPTFPGMYSVQEPLPQLIRDR